MAVDASAVQARGAWRFLDRRMTGAATPSGPHPMVQHLIGGVRCIMSSSQSAV